LFIIQLINEAECVIDALFGEVFKPAARTPEFFAQPLIVHERLPQGSGCRPPMSIESLTQAAVQAGRRLMAGKQRELAARTASIRDQAFGLATAEVIEDVKARLLGAPR
jgi:hypothetical protein